MNASEETVAVPMEVAKKLAHYQGQMVEYLKLLAGEERLEQAKTVVVQQALMLHAIEKLNENMQGAGEKLEVAVNKLDNVFWGLMKVPVAVTVIACASWAFLYMDKISQNVWLAMVGVSVFPWLGESITAFAKIFGIGKANQLGNGEKK